MAFRRRQNGRDDEIPSICCGGSRRVRAAPDRTECIHEESAYMRTKRTLRMLVVAGLLIAGCGGSSKTGASTSTLGKTTTAPAGSLVLQPSETPSGFTLSTAPSTAPA